MLADCAISERGAAAARALLPATERQEAERLMAQTKEAESISISNAAHPMMGFDDLSGELTRLKAGAGLSCAELLRVSRLVKAAKRAKRGLPKMRTASFGFCPELAENLFYDDMLIRRIDDAILSEEEIADQASPALRDIRRRQRNENAFVREKLNAIIRSKEHAAHLQDADHHHAKWEVCCPGQAGIPRQCPGVDSRAICQRRDAVYRAHEHC